MQLNIAMMLLLIIKLNLKFNKVLTFPNILVLVKMPNDSIQTSQVSLVQFQSTNHKIPCKSKILKLKDIQILVITYKRIQTYTDH